MKEGTLLRAYGDPDVAFPPPTQPFVPLRGYGRCAGVRGKTCTTLLVEGSGRILCSFCTGTLRLLREREGR
jgi:hypothetical protein